jgi:hypothetical protein
VQKSNSGAVGKFDLSCTLQTVASFKAESKSLLDPEQDSPAGMISDVVLASGAEE